MCSKKNFLIGGLLTRNNFQTIFYINKSFSDTHVDNSPFLNVENFNVVKLFPISVFPLVPSGYTKQYYLIQPLKVIIGFIILPQYNTQPVDMVTFVNVWFFHLYYIKILITQQGQNK
jgi:hypothetical protein